MNMYEDGFQHFEIQSEFTMKQQKTSPWYYGSALCTLKLAEKLNLSAPTGVRDGFLYLAAPG